MEERMMILKMLQEGKITPDEANKLIEAIERGSTRDNSNRVNTINIEEKINRIGEKAGKAAEKLNKSFNSNAEKIQSNADKVAGDFSKRFESFGNDMAEAAVKFSDKLVNFLNNTFDIGYDKYEYSKTYTYPATSLANINLKATNFAIKAAPSDGDEIIVNIYANSTTPDLNLDEHFIADISDNNYALTCEFSNRTWGKIELLIPQNIVSMIIDTTNGRCEINEINAESIKSHTTNGKVLINNCKLDNITAITNNGRVVFKQDTAKTANISTSNGRIDISESQIDNIEAKTSNGSIKLSEITKPQSSEGRYNLRTSNGKISLVLCNTDDCSFVVDANTSLGGIHTNLPESSYTIDKKGSNINSSAIITSTNKDTAENKIFIKANTSNASITIENDK